MEYLEREVIESGVKWLKDKNDGAVLRVALVDSTEWPIFQGLNTFYGAGKWSLVKVDVEEKNK